MERIAAPLPLSVCEDQSYLVRQQVQVSPLGNHSQISLTRLLQVLQGKGAVSLGNPLPLSCVTFASFITYPDALSHLVPS